LEFKEAQVDAYRIRLAWPPRPGGRWPAGRPAAAAGGVAGKQASQTGSRQGNGARRACCDFASSFACPIVNKLIILTKRLYFSLDFKR
jgi:hypothetical protein